MPGTKLTSLTEFSGAITDNDLQMYMVDESDTALDSAGSGYRIPVHKNFVVTDGLNPVQILSGGTLDLGGQAWSIADGTGGELVTSTGEQDIYNKSLLIKAGEAGPVIEVRETDFVLFDDATLLSTARFDLTKLAAGAHIYELPDSDGLSQLIDTEAPQTLANKTLDWPHITVQDTEMIFTDTGNLNRTFWFEILWATDRDITIEVPSPAADVTQMVLTDATQTLTDKTLEHPKVNVLDSDLVIYDSLVGIDRLFRFEILGSTPRDNTINIPEFPSASGEMVIHDATQELSNKTLLTNNRIEVEDGSFFLVDGTAKVRFELLSGFADGEQVINIAPTSRLIGNTGAVTVSDKTFDASNTWSKGPIILDTVTGSGQTDGRIEWATTGKTLRVGDGTATRVFSDDTAFYKTNELYTKTELQTSGQSAVHWNNLTNKPSTYAPSAHDHNTLYFTEAEADARFAPISHNHDSRYFTETESDARFAPTSHTQAWSTITSKPSILGPATFVQRHPYSGGTVGGNAFYTTTLGTNAVLAVARWISNRGSGEATFLRGGTDRTAVAVDWEGASYLTIHYDDSARTLTFDANLSMALFDLIVDEMALPTA